MKKNKSPTQKKVSSKVLTKIKEVKEKTFTKTLIAIDTEEKIKLQVFCVKNKHNFTKKINELITNFNNENYEQ